jgi:hypothetical protein
MAVFNIFLIVLCSNFELMVFLYFLIDLSVVGLADRRAERDAGHHRAGHVLPDQRRIDGEVQRRHRNLQSFLQVRF